MSYLIPTRGMSRSNNHTVRPIPFLNGVALACAVIVPSMSSPGGPSPKEGKKFQSTSSKATTG